MVAQLERKGTPTDISSDSSTRSKPAKKGLKGLFTNRRRRSSSPSTIFSAKIPSTVHSNSFDMKEDDDVSSEDERSYPNSYHAENDPLCFKSSMLKFKKASLGTDTHNINALEMVDDDDYAKYLKQPKYIKTFKKSHEVDITKRLFLAQELNQGSDSLNEISQDINDIRLNPGDAFETNEDSDSSLYDGAGGNGSVGKNVKSNAVWAMKFNNDGKYLATAGKNNNIKVWKVISSPLDRMTNDSTTQNGKTMYASVFQPLPLRVYSSHTHDILSLDWSKNDFLLSSSMDKTVKLWNLKEDQALRTYPHGDFVTSVKFHPTDDRFFVSGCLDHKVRLWSILDNDVSFEFDAKSLVTAIGFTPNGNLTIVGTFNGIVYFLDTSTLELRHSVQLNKKRSTTGAKITGIETFIDGDDIKIVITSNDSKVRLLSLRHRQLEFYFKGPINESSQIIASISDDNKYIISGSENHWVYLWDTVRSENSHNHDPFKKLVSNKKKRKDYTSFHAHHSTVTCALIAPLGTGKALSLSNDFIYELNTEMEKRESPEAFVTTSIYNKEFIGSIIVTADDNGIIRIFRQDFPSSVRKMLLVEGSRKRKNSTDNVVIITNTPINENSRSLYMTKNSSATSLLTRGYSFRKKDAGNGDDDYKGRGRSRNNTVGSTSHGTSPAGDRSNIYCNVCGGDKFSFMKNEDVSENGMHGDKKIGVFCKDCGNQLN